MKLCNIKALLFAAALAGTNALSPSTHTSNNGSMVGAISLAVNRRTAFTGIAAASMMAGIAPANAVGAEAFVGTFSDPINHPGGKRNIKLLEGKKVGDYQLAEVYGGGGRGEPSSYILPAAIIGDRTIVIDFSPKGGPRDFVGVLDKGNIKFLKDGNVWPRQ